MASEASNLIETALAQGLSSFEDYKEGDVIVEWVLIAYVDNPERESGGGYPRFLSNGVMPEHRLKGLLMQGLDDLRNDEFFGRISSLDDD